jgi:hypothetical protein
MILPELLAAPLGQTRDAPRPRPPATGSTARSFSTSSRTSRSRTA